MNHSNPPNTSLEADVAFKSLWQAIRGFQSIGVSVLSRDGQCLFANEAYARCLQLDATTPRPKLEEIDDSAIAQETLEFIARVCDTGEPVVVRRPRMGFMLTTELAPWQPNADSGTAEYVIAFTQFSGLADELPGTTNMVNAANASWGELSRLTPRQLEVLAMLRQGHTPREIATLLAVAPKTVETHRDQLVRRLNCKSTLEAIRFADRAGLTVEAARNVRKSNAPWEQHRQPSQDPSDVADSSPTTLNVEIETTPEVERSLAG